MLSPVTDGIGPQTGRALVERRAGRPLPYCCFRVRGAPEQEVKARVAGVRRTLAAPAAEFDPTPPGLFACDPPPEFVPLLSEIFAAVRRESLRTLLLVMAEADQRDLLPRIDAPTLLIWGELDARSPLTVAHQFEKAIPDTKLVLIPGAGHLSNLEQPERFNEAVREFCRAHPAGQSEDPTRRG
jgi:pimeloyl-ACP methyl ester carboxylesterase